MTESLGVIEINDDVVVGSIAGHCVGRTPGVACVSEGVVDGLSRMILSAEATRGVRVLIKKEGEKSAVLDLFVNVEEGTTIPAVAASLQRSVRDAVEAMTGFHVESVNVHVRDIVRSLRKSNTEVEEEGENGELVKKPGAGD